MADLKKTIEIIFEGNDQASRKAADVLGKVKELEVQAKATSASTDGVAKSLDDIGKKDVAVAKAAEAMRLLAGALVVDRFIDANVALEKFTKTMTAAGFDATQSGAQFEYVARVADRFGIGVLEAASSFSLFSNATRGSSVEGEKARLIFEAFTGTMSRVGAKSHEIDGAFVQLAQGISKGKFELEDLKSIAERVPGFFVALADALGVSTAELFKMISAGKIGADEIFKFSEALNRSLGSATFDGYVNSMARLRNAIDLALIDIGKAGAFDALIAGVKAVTAVISGAISSVTLFGELVGAFFALLSSANTADYGIFGADFAAFGENAKASIDKAAASTKSLLDAFEGTDRAATKAGGAITAGMDQGKKATAELGKNTAEVDKLLKELGVNPDKIKKPIDDLILTFEKLASNPAVRGDQILAGLAKTLKDVKDKDDLGRLGADIVTAFAKGKLTADEFAQATKLLDDAQSKLAGTLPKTKTAADDQAKALAKQAEETRKAEESAQRFRLEMEKIASNERIKNIEAKVKLNIAEIEAQTKRVEAAFESINTTVNSTGDLLGDLFGALKDYDNLSFRASGLIEKQISLENDRRAEALALQKKLIEAQVDQLRAQTRAVERGDSVIKVDGAGLQPHLEAFMWEILRQIQVRVNADGLKLLLGV